MRTVCRLRPACSCLAARCHRDSLENATLGSPDYRTTTKKLSFGAVDAEAENVVGAPDAKQAAEDDCPLKVCPALGFAVGAGA